MFKFMKHYKFFPPKIIFDKIYNILTFQEIKIYD